MLITQQGGSAMEDNKNIIEQLQDKVEKLEQDIADIKSVLEIQDEDDDFDYDSDEDDMEDDSDEDSDEDQDEDEIEDEDDYPKKKKK